MNETDARPGEGLNQSAATEPGRTSAPAPQQRGGRRWMVVAIVCAVVLAFGGLWLAERSRQLNRSPEVVVARRSPGSVGTTTSLQSTTETSLPPASGATGSSGSSGGSPADTAEIKRQLDAIESELNALSLPSDQDFSDAESALQ